MRSTSRTTGVSINTVTKLLVDAGHACAAYYDETVRTSKHTVSNATKFSHSATPSRRMPATPRLLLRAMSGLDCSRRR